MQLIEGPHMDAINATYDRIQADSRHEVLSILFEDQISARFFPDWTMGYRAADDMPSGSLNTIYETARSLNNSLPDQRFSADVRRIRLNKNRVPSQPPKRYRSFTTRLLITGSWNASLSRSPKASCLRSGAADCRDCKPHRSPSGAQFPNGSGPALSTG